MIRKTLYIIIIFSFWMNVPTAAQYRRLVSLSGQVFDDNQVTVTFTGQPPSFPGVYLCGIGPYQIGTYSSNIFVIVTPLSYTFTFANPVDHIRIDAGDLWNIDIIAVEINNVPYTLNNAQLLSAPNNCNSNVGQAIIVGGNLTAPFAPQPSGANGYYAGRVNIHEPNILSVTVSYLGSYHPLGLSGSCTSFYFGQISASNSGPLCAGDSLQLWGDTTITELGTFYWTGPNGYTSSQQNPVIAPFTAAQAGVYTLRYITGADTFTDTTAVRVLPGPTIPTITADSPVCAGSVLHLSAVSTPGATYTWSGPNRFTALGEVVSIFDVQDADAGRYMVTASLSGCMPSAYKDIALTYPVQYSFTEVVCAPVAGYEFNGTKIFNSGNYADTFPASNGCDSVVKLNLVVLPVPEISIGITDEGTFCIGDSLQVSAIGNAIHYNWFNTAGDQLGSLPELRLVLLSLANPILLVGVGDNQCMDSADLIVTAEGCCQLWLPTAFSPNGDGINDVFILPDHGHFPNYRMDIFNRWGQRVFSSANRNVGWDGTIGGSPADIGTYHYYIVADCIAGPESVKKGEIILIR